MNRAFLSITLAAAALIAIPVVAQTNNNSNGDRNADRDYDWQINDYDNEISGRDTDTRRSRTTLRRGGAVSGGSDYRLPDRAEAAAELQVVAQQERRAWNLAGDQYQEARNRAQQRVRESSGFDQTLRKAGEARNKYRERRQRVMDQLEQRDRQYRQLVQQEEQLQQQIDRARRNGRSQEAARLANDQLDVQNRIDRLEDRALENDQQYGQLKQQMTQTQDELDRAERRIERGIRSDGNAKELRQRALAARSRWENARAEAYGAATEYSVAEDAQLQEDRLRYGIAEETYRGDDDLDIDWDD